MTYLLDTNVIAEIRKGARGNANVRSWFAALDQGSIRLSVLTVGEIRRGIENVRRRDQTAARALERWLRGLVADYADDILGVDRVIAEEWGRLNVPDPMPVIDGLFVATAKVHGLTLATRTVKDVARAGIDVVAEYELALENVAARQCEGGARFQRAERPLICVPCCADTAIPATSERSAGIRRATMPACPIQSSRRAT